MASGVNILSSANGTIDLVRKQTNEAIVFCSMGKDSLALLDLVYPKFDRVICVFMYFVKGLEHVEKYIRWARVKYPGVELIQLPHWNLSYLLRDGIYCVANPDVKLIKLSDVVSAVNEKTGVNYTFLGMKKADSINRRLMLNTYPNGINNGKAYPLSNWTNKEVMAYLRSRNIPDPVMYSNKASGGMGFNLDCFSWMREHYPGDLEKVLRVFPLSARILFEHDNKVKDGRKEKI
jgi:sulfate adenylyltransferase subunit 2